MTREGECLHEQNKMKTEDLFYLPYHGNSYDRIKVSFSDDNRQTNCGVFTVYAEDHTLGNALRQRTGDVPEVDYTTFCQPHPLENHIEIRVQCKRSCEGYTPKMALSDGLTSLMAESDILLDRFQEALETYKAQSASA